MPPTGTPLGGWIPSTFRASPRLAWNLTVDALLFIRRTKQISFGSGI